MERVDGECLELVVVISSLDCGQAQTGHTVNSIQGCLCCLETARMSVHCKLYNHHCPTIFVDIHNPKAK